MTPSAANRVLATPNREIESTEVGSTRTPHLIQCGEAAKIQVTEGEVNWTYVCFTRGETSPAGSWLRLESAATRGEAQLGSAV